MLSSTSRIASISSNCSKSSSTSTNMARIRRNVRQKAKDITNLLTDEARLHQERVLRANLRNLMLGQPEQEDGNDEPVVPRGDENTAHRAKGVGGDDELQRAIEESRCTLAAKQGRRCVRFSDLAKAIKLSEEEEARRKASLGDPGSLFYDPYVCVSFYR